MLKVIGSIVCKCNIPCHVPLRSRPAMAIARCASYHIKKGHYNEVSLAGLNLLALGQFVGNIWAAKQRRRMGIFIDERANEKNSGKHSMMIWAGQKAGGFLRSLLS